MSSQLKTPKPNSLDWADTIITWATHFLYSNYLSVLLKPSFEEPVETVEDIINRNLIPFFADGGEFYKQFFADSPDPNYREISRRLVVAKDWEEYEEMVRKRLLQDYMLTLEHLHFGLIHLKK